MSQPPLYRFRSRFHRLVQAAQAQGLTVVVDASAIAIRLINTEEAQGNADLRQLGVIVKVNNACGGASTSGRSPTGDA